MDDDKEHPPLHLHLKLDTSAAAISSTSSSPSPDLGSCSGSGPCSRPSDNARRSGGGDGDDNDGIGDTIDDDDEGIDLSNSSYHHGMLSPHSPTSPSPLLCLVNRNRSRSRSSSRHAQSDLTPLDSASSSSSVRRQRAEQLRDGNGNTLSLTPFTNPFNRNSALPPAFTSNLSRQLSGSGRDNNPPLQQPANSPARHQSLISHPLSAPVQPRQRNPFAALPSQDWPRETQSISAKDTFFPFSSPSSARNSASKKTRRSTEASSFLSQFSFRQPDPPKPDDEGQVVFDDWVIGRKIGHGGFSQVKLAVRRTRGHEQVRAIKIVKKKVDCASEETNETVQLVLEHEIGIWRHLSHPHIVPLEFVHQDNYATWFFMPYVAGGTLLELMSRNRDGLGVGRAKRYVRQLVSALLYLHEDVRVVHRDIKPENCLLASLNSDPSGADLPPLMLSDFGMATWLDTDDDITSVAPYGSEAETSQAQSQVQNILSRAGTLDYLSPEKLVNPGAVLGAAADIWALGAVIFCCVVGSKPFHASMDAVMVQKILNSDWNRQAVLNALSKDHQSEGNDVLELIQACLSVVPEARPSIREVLEYKWLRGVQENEDDDVAPLHLK